MGYYHGMKNGSTDPKTPSTRLTPDERGLIKEGANVQKLRTLGFVHAGAIRPSDSGTSCYADLDREVEGCVVYALVVGGLVMKFGSAGRENATLRDRMRSTASTLNGVLRLADGRPLSDAGWQRRRLDAFKQHAPAVIAANQEIEVWAKNSTASTCAAEELELNLKFKPEWKKSTNSTDPTTLSIRLTPGELRTIKEAAGKKGWKAAHFLRVSALERAAQALNLSRPSSFDFSGAAKRFAEVLIAPRTVRFADPDLPYESWAPFGEGPLNRPEYEGVLMTTMHLADFRPAPLTREQVEELQEAMRLGGAEFAAELIVECRRLGGVANDSNLPPPIDPHNIKGSDSDASSKNIED
jgi:uncharacterized protein (DUF1778 family)